MVLPEGLEAALTEQQLRGSSYGTSETPWLLQRNPVLGEVNDWLRDSLVDFGRTSPTLAGAGQLIRLGVLGDGTNLDAGLAALPFFGRLARGASALERFAVPGADSLVERASLQLGEQRSIVRLGEEVPGGSERYLGLLNRNSEPLTLAQMTEARAYAQKLGLPEDRLQFFSHGGAHQRSAYSDLFDTVFVGPDLLPGSGAGLSANSRVSANGLLAHEIVGHRETTLAGKAFEAGSLYDEVQASWRAARLAPDLTSTERYTLLRDAVERVHAEGLKVRDLDKSMFWFGRP